MHHSEMAQLECSWAKGWWLVMHQSLFSRRLKEWKKVELAAAAAAALVSLPYAPRYSCCWWCSIPTMNTQRLSYIAQLHKTFVLQQSSGWITDQTCIASIIGSTTFWSHNWIFVCTPCSWVCHIKMILLKSFISRTTTLVGTAVRCCCWT